MLSRASGTVKLVGVSITPATSALRPSTFLNTQLGHPDLRLRLQFHRNDHLRDPAPSTLSLPAKAFASSSTASPAAPPTSGTTPALRPTLQHPLPLQLEFRVHMVRPQRHRRHGLHPLRNLHHHGGTMSATSPPSSSPARLLPHRNHLHHPRRHHVRRRNGRRRHRRPRPHRAARDAPAPNSPASSCPRSPRACRRSSPQHHRPFAGISTVDRSNWTHIDDYGLRETTITDRAGTRIRDGSGYTPSRSPSHTSRLQPRRRHRRPPAASSAASSVPSGAPSAPSSTPR